MSEPRYLIMRDYYAGDTEVKPRDGDVVCDLSSSTVAIYIHPYQKLPQTDDCGQIIDPADPPPDKSQLFVTVPKTVTQMQNLWKQTKYFEIAVWTKWKYQIIYQFISVNPTITHLVGVGLKQEWTVYVLARIRWEYWYAHVVFDVLDTGRVMCCLVMKDHRETVCEVNAYYKRLREPHLFVEVDTLLLFQATQDLRDQFGALVQGYATSDLQCEFQVPYSRRHELRRLIELLPRDNALKPPAQYPVDKRRQVNTGEVKWCHFAVFRWPYYYEQIIYAAFALCDTNLPPYCVLWIINFIPDMHRWPDSLKIACIERIYASAKRVRGRELIEE